MRAREKAETSSVLLHAIELLRQLQIRDLAPAVVAQPGVARRLHARVERRILHVHLHGDDVAAFERFPKPLIPRQHQFRTNPANTVIAPVPVMSPENSKCRSTVPATVIRCAAGSVVTFVKVTRSA